MSASKRRANVRINISKNLPETVYPRGALIMVAGAGEGYTGPVTIYPDLAKEIVEYPNIIAVQMDYRFSGDLNPCIVGQLAQKGKACLFIHGTGDQCLPYRCSEQLYRLAGQLKELVLYEQDNYGVTKHRHEAKEKLKEFTLSHLSILTK